jgi:hypothetical protein
MPAATPPTSPALCRQRQFQASRDRPDRRRGVLCGLRQSLGIGLTDAQFLEGWNAIFTGEMPGIAPLLAGAAKRMPLYAFSNTNAGPISRTFSQGLCRTC